MRQVDKLPKPHKPKHSYFGAIGFVYGIALGGRCHARNTYALQFGYQTKTKGKLAHKVYRHRVELPYFNDIFFYQLFHLVGSTSRGYLRKGHILHTAILPAGGIYLFLAPVGGGVIGEV